MMRNILISTDYNYLKYSLKLIESILITSNLNNHKIFIHIENETEKTKKYFINLFNKYKFNSYEFIFIETEHSIELFKYVPKKYWVIYRRLFAPRFLKKSFLYLDIDGIVYNDINISFDFLEKHVTKPFYISVNMDKVISNFDKRDLDLFDFLKRLRLFYKGEYTPQAFDIISKYKSYVFTASVYYRGDYIEDFFFEELINQYKKIGSYNIDECGSWDELLLNICMFKNNHINNLFQKTNIHFDITLNKVYHHFGPFKMQLKNPLISCRENIDTFEFPRKGFFSQLIYFEVLMIFKHKLSISDLYEKNILNKKTVQFYEILYKEITKNKEIILKNEGKSIYDDLIDDYKKLKGFLDENYSNI